MPTSTRPPARPRAQLGRYALGARLGEGGMAEVFRSEIAGAAGFTKPVAIKRVRAALAQDAQICEAFVQEARVARRMEHGNIVQIYDLGSEDGVPYLVLELVDGLSLAEVLAARRAAGQRLAVADALYIIEHVGAALRYAHQLTDEAGLAAGVIHRDITPRNILVSREGVVKLADFGIAKVRRMPSETLPGTIKGTLGYLSPEQAGGEAVDARSDQFSAGLVLYEMLAGQNPLAVTDDLYGYFRMLAEDGVPPLPVAPNAPPSDAAASDAGVPAGQGVDQALAGIVARAVAVRPADRYPSMADLLAELEAWRVARGIRTGPDGLQRAIRGILGEVSTGRALRLDDALGAELDARAPRRTQARAGEPAGPRGQGQWRRWMGLVLAAAAVAAGAAGVWLAGGAGAGETAPPQMRRPEQSQAQGQMGSQMQSERESRTQRPTQSSGQTPTQTPTQPPEQHRDAALAPRSPQAPPQAPPAPAARDRRPGRVKINLLPYARVHIGGRALGTTPVDAPLSAGTHTLILENPDTGQRQRRTIQVAPGQVLNIRSW